MDRQMKQILELVSQPAFLAKEDRIIWCNAVARSLLLENAVLSLLLKKNAMLFSLWNKEGTLQIPLSIGGKEYQASVQALEDGDLFIAGRRSQEQNLTADTAVNISAALRRPLQGMMSAAIELFEELESQKNEKLSSASARLNRSIYQFQRLCGQMSDGGRLLLHRKTAQRESREVNTFFAAFVKRAAPMVESLGLSLEFTPLPSSLWADIDTELLERALYNLLSNALNYTHAGGRISIGLKRQDRMLLVSVSDNGEGISPDVLSTLFERFTDRSIGDARWGLGLGLPMAREIAQLHGGDLVVSPNPLGKGTSVTFSLSLEQSPLELRSRSLRYDYCGGLDHGLVELSDVLDARYFDPKEI